MKKAAYEKSAADKEMPGVPEGSLREEAMDARGMKSMKPMKPLRSMGMAPAKRYPKTNRSTVI